MVCILGQNQIIGSQVSLVKPFPFQTPHLSFVPFSSITHANPTLFLAPGALNTRAQLLFTTTPPSSCATQHPPHGEQQVSEAGCRAPQNTGIALAMTQEETKATTRLLWIKKGQAGKGGRQFCRTMPVFSFRIRNKFKVKKESPSASLGNAMPTPNIN